MGPIKTEKKTWRKVNEERKKWKGIRMEKQLEKNLLAKESKVQTQPQSSQPPKEIRTCSIAIAGSIIQNAQSQELRAYVAGQIARAACIYKVNEIVIFNDKGTSKAADDPILKRPSQFCGKFARLLQYLECPQYLRKYFFPIHNDLQYAGLMNSLDAPHHLRQDTDFPFREGVTTDKPLKKDEEGTYVNCGLLNEVLVDKSLQPGIRVTVKILPSKSNKKLRGVIVSPEVPIKELNVYWGYNVRIAHSLSDVFSKCPYKEGYDLTIGTSEKGTNIDEIKEKLKLNLDYKHCLIAFGGLHGLEDALENDDTLEAEEVNLLFNYYLNTCPNQGSGTIRTEEAVLITLAELRTIIMTN